MKVVTLAVAALAAPFAHAAPTVLTSRQVKARELIQPDLFPVLQRYTKFAAASLATFVFGLGSCPNPPFNSTLVRKIENIISDTQVAIFQDDTAKEFIISFPGTYSVGDLLTDINYPLTNFTTVPSCTGCEVHQGVFSAWLSVRKRLITALAELCAQHRDYSILSVGHSLGGGLASIAYTDLIANNVPVRAAYTMGAFRVGNKAYADFTDNMSGASDTQLGTFIRITHGIDGVPNLPTIDMGFRHTRTEIYQLDDAAKTQTAATSYRCYGQEANDCNLGTAQGFINQDHLKYTGIKMANGDTCKSTD